METITDEELARLKRLLYEDELELLRVVPRRTFRTWRCVLGIHWYEPTSPWSDTCRDCGRMVARL
jgi:hypothetical protein